MTGKKCEPRKPIYGLWALCIWRCEACLSTYVEVVGQQDGNSVEEHAVDFLTIAEKKLVLGAARSTVSVRRWKLEAGSAPSCAVKSASLYDHEILLYVKICLGYHSGPEEHVLVTISSLCSSRFGQLDL